MTTLKDKSYKLFENGNIQKEVIETKDIKEHLLDDLRDLKDFQNTLLFHVSDDERLVFEFKELFKVHNMLKKRRFGDWEEKQ